MNQALRSRHLFGWSRGDRYGAIGSSHAAGYTPGAEWDEFDEFLLEPSTGWSGSRGAVPSFGEDDETDSQLDNLLQDLERDEEDFGRLYRHSGDLLEQASEADPGVVIGRSGTPGYRGARPFFGADDRTRVKAGSFEYEGPQFGAVVLGIAAIALAFKAAL